MVGVQTAESGIFARQDEHREALLASSLGPKEQR